MAIMFLDKSAKITLTDVFNVSLTLGDGTTYNDVELRRLFPISDRDHYISLIDKNEKEIAMIRSYDDITPESAAGIALTLVPPPLLLPPPPPLLPP